MTKRILHTNDAPAPIGPYSQAVQVEGCWVFTSGQIPLNPESGELVTGSIEAQTRQVFKNLAAVLAAGGAGFEQVVKATIYLRDMDDFAAVNAIYAEYFGEEAAPARSTVEVARLPKDVGIEIDLIAVT